MGSIFLYTAVEAASRERSSLLWAYCFLPCSRLSCVRQGQREGSCCPVVRDTLQGQSAAMSHGNASNYAEALFAFLAEDFLDEQVALPYKEAGE